MKGLATLFEGAGCTGVSTYIQSGNVIVHARASVAKTLSAMIEAAILARYGLTVPVIVRSAAEMIAVPGKNPFLPRADPALLYVGFLAGTPTRAQIASLDAGRSPPDELAVVGKELYLCLPNGAGRTKLTNAYFDRALGTVSTMRNWRTVLKLAELTAGSAP